MTTVLSVAYPFAPVTADPVGGAEQVLAAVDRALVAAGRRSVVVAQEGSSVAGELAPVPAVTGEITPAERGRVHAAVREAVAAVLARERVDVVHLHGIDFPAYAPDPAPGAPPVLATLHLPVDWYDPAALRRPGLHLNAVSPHQAAGAPADLRPLPVVENGVDVEAYDLDLPRGDDLVALGRICPEKGLHLALDAARLADARLFVAGACFAYGEHRRYFDGAFAPRLDARRRWIGPVGGVAKRRLLATARAVLIPSLAPETSSLVAREAAAAGAPVVAFRSGALAEAVEHGRTGWLVDPDEGAAGLAAALARVDEIDPAACRAAARARFPLRGMTDGYLLLHDRLVAGAPNGDGRRPAAAA